MLCALFHLGLPTSAFTDEWLDRFRELTFSGNDLDQRFDD
jgi:hypothetical protein